MHGSHLGAASEDFSMTSLRTRLFRAIALTVALCVGLTVAVGLVLTRRAVDRATLRDVSHQADLIARSQDVNSTVSPLTNLPSLQPYFDKQHMSYLDAHRRASAVGEGQARARQLGGRLGDAERLRRVLRRAHRQRQAVRAAASEERHALALDAVRLQPARGGSSPASSSLRSPRSCSRAASRGRSAGSRTPRAASHAAPSRIPCRSRAPPSSRRSRPRSTTSPRSSRARARPSATSCSRSATS